LKNFQILEGVYTFLAYLAFVQDDKDFYTMSTKLDDFMLSKGLTTKEMLQFNRFGKNYLLSLPLKKKLYYLLYFFGFKGLIRKLISRN